MVLGGALIASAPAIGAQTAADLVLHSGKVVVVDDPFTVHQAIVVRDGRIIAVGEND